MKMTFSQSRGFTLVEIITVLGIIAVLAAVAIASMSDARENARDKKRISDIGQIQLALKLYQVQNDAYPSGYDAGADVATVTDLENFGTIPVDPLNSLTHLYMYDTDFNCTSAGQTVVYANAMEKSFANEDAVCGGTGGTKYIIVLQ